MWFWCGLDENRLSGGIRLDCRQREGESGTVQGDFVIGSKSSSEGTTGATQKTHSHIISARHCGDASLPAIKQNCIYLGIMFNLIRVNLCTSVTPRCFQKQQIHLDRYASQAAGVIKADESLCRAHGKATRSAGHRDASFLRTMHPKSLYELSKHNASYRLCGLACAEISLCVRITVGKEIEHKAREETSQYLMQ